MLPPVRLTMYQPWELWKRVAAERSSTRWVKSFSALSSTWKYRRFSLRMCSIISTTHFVWISTVEGPLV